MITLCYNYTILWFSLSEALLQYNNAMQIKKIFEILIGLTYCFEYGFKYVKIETSNVSYYI